MTCNLVEWLFWFVVGLLTLIKGDISRLSYACVWVVMLAYMAMYFKE